MKTIICRGCSQPFEVKPYRETVAKFCSYACRNKDYLGTTPANKGITPCQITLTCAECGKSFDALKSRLKHGRGKHCSPECQYKSNSQKLRKDVSLECFGCGKTFVRPPSRKAKSRYCSRPCRDANRIGEKHPQYLGGPTAKRGPNWAAQRRAALKRDNQTCQHCGELGLSVHHVKPFRIFSDYREANCLENLISLCWPCHRKADAKIQSVK